MDDKMMKNVTAHFRGMLRGIVRFNDIERTTTHYMEWLHMASANADTPEDFAVLPGMAHASVCEQYAILSLVQSIGVVWGTAHAGGYANLGETIMVQQAHRIREFKQSAYKLSDKQVAAVIREHWDALKEIFQDEAIGAVD